VALEIAGRVQMPVILEVVRHEDQVQLALVLEGELANERTIGTADSEAELPGLARQGGGCQLQRVLRSRGGVLPG
jgi:hypothetical protein